MGVRRQGECPACRETLGLFFTRHSSGAAVYRCHNELCGLLYLGTHPEARPGGVIVAVEPRRMLRRPVLLPKPETIRAVRGRA